MADNTSIEWTDATWNPVSGCTKVSAGCRNCYAERVFPRAYPSRDREGAVARKFTDVRCHPERLIQPLHWRKPRRIFVNSMSDLFHEDVPDEFIERVFAVMALGRRHTFQVLTKRPERMLGFCSALTSKRIIQRCNESVNGGPHGPGAYNLASINHLSAKKRFVEDGDKSVHWPLEAPPLSNVWLGVSVEDQETADERIPLLLQTPAAVRFVSYEPALAPVDFSAWLPGPIMVCGAKAPMPAESARALRALGNAAFKYVGGKILDWLIAGGESGPNARPSHPDWFRSVRDQCIAAGIPFFFKQWGAFRPVAPEEPEKANEWVLDGIGVGGEFAQAVRMQRIGKKAAGRLLDGREWNEFPEDRC